MMRSYEAVLERFCLLAAAPCLAGAERWTVDDVLLLESASGLQVARDGTRIVWVKSQMDKEKGEAVAQIQLRYLADGTEVPLTRGKDSNTSPKFSPDSKQIAFLSTRKLPDAKPEDKPAAQVWLLNALGGEPSPLTKFKRGVKTFAWVDPNTLLLVAAEDPSYYDQRTEERKDTSQVVDDEVHAPPVRLFRLDLKTRTTRRLTDNQDRIEQLEVSPDGRWALTVHDRSLQYIYNQKVRPAAFLHDLTTNTSVRLFPDDKLVVGHAAWRPDSKGFYFSAPYTTHAKYINASIAQLHYYDVAAKQEKLIDLDWPNGLAGDFAVTPDGFLALLANGAQPKPALYTAAGNGFTRSMLTGKHAGHMFQLEASDDGKMVFYQYSTASMPAQWYRATLEGGALKDESPITSLNGALAQKTLAKSEVITWKGAKDESVEGILVYPHQYQPGKKYPLVVMIHGGPHGVDYDAFRDSWGYPTNLMAQRGAFVLRPNYHGSSNYGLQWGESIAGGNYNDLEWVDVEKGVDSLIAKGLVDPAQLGIMGWSNGSIITIELTTRTTRYKAASAGAGDVNWVSDWANAVFGDAFDSYYFGKNPLEDVNLYIRKSPLFRMEKVRTPTIIFFGTEDKQVPTEQGWQHYRALQHYGQTDVRFLLFPGEAHGPRKYVHQRRKLDEELAWFDKHLFRTAGDLNESLKPESPLAAALKWKAAGAMPEMVPHGKLRISRFEVTRVQFAAFDSSYRYPAGTERYPANNVAFAKAQAYCAWLSKRTGQKYRLPSEEEMLGLTQPARHENTLDNWAGYEVNSDDAKRLASIIDGLGNGALLQPVGTHPGSGDDPLYDLGGNVAEWVVSKEGKGKAIGGSADRPADSKSLTPARADYVGFRLVSDAE